MLSVKKCFLMSSPNILGHSFEPSPHTLSLDTREKHLPLHFLSSHGTWTEDFFFPMESPLIGTWNLAVNILSLWEGERSKESRSTHVVLQLLKKNHQGGRRENMAGTSILCIITAVLTCCRKTILLWLSKMMNWWKQSHWLFCYDTARSEKLQFRNY